MKLEITVEDMTPEAQRIILRDIKAIIQDYKIKEGLKRFLKVKEVK